MDIHEAYEDMVHDIMVTERREAMNVDMKRCGTCGRIIMPAPKGDPWEGFYMHKEDDMASCYSDGNETANYKGKDEV